jgi:DNA-binding transcriptional ArsR family regulator/protein-L-isoaspartate O-methyltransferase
MDRTHRKSQVLSPAAPANEETFRALSDPTRQKIMQLLLRAELNVSELVEILNQPQSTVSRHLRVLSTAGLADDRRAGTTAYYSAHPAGAESQTLTARLMVWLSEQPIPQGLEERLQRALRERDGSSVGFFDRLGRKWDDLRRGAFGEAFAFEAMIGLLPSEWTVADIGTGTGFLLPILAEHFSRVIAIEPAANMLECAKRRLTGKAPERVSFQQGDLSHLPMADASCNLVIAGLVIHHVERPSEALLEMHRVLRPGGRVLIIEQQSHENQKFYETMQDRWWGFEPREFCRMLGKAGFADTRSFPLHTAQPDSPHIESPKLFAVTCEKPKK